MTLARIAAAALTLAASLALAQYPAKPVRVLIGYAAGSSTPETREKLAKIGVALFESDQEAFKNFFNADIEKWKNLVKNTGLKLE